MLTAHGEEDIRRFENDMGLFTCRLTLEARERIKEAYTAVAEQVTLRPQPEWDVGEAAHRRWVDRVTRNRIGVAEDLELVREVTNPGGWSNMAVKSTLLGSGRSRAARRLWLQHARARLMPRCIAYPGFESIAEKIGSLEPTLASGDWSVDWNSGSSNVAVSPPGASEAC